MDEKKIKDYCTLYLVRHGETEWNLKELVQGHTDIPLNKKGEQQAKEMARKLKAIKLAAAFSSDLVRARRTAEIIALEREIIVKTTKALRERFFGRLEGKRWLDQSGELKFLWEKLASLTDKERKLHHLEKVENNEDLMRRFIPFLREVAVAYRGKNVLVVSHGGIMRTFLIHLGFGNNKSLPAGSIDNLAYIKLTADGVDFFVKETFGIEKNPLDKEKKIIFNHY
jgi:broad specificity phosphatase PhoE